MLRSVFRNSRRVLQKGGSVADGYGNMGTSATGATSRTKTSMQITIPYREAGSLQSLLGIFKDHGISLSRINSREMPEVDTRDYVTMFVDFEQRVEDKNVQAAIAKVKETYPYYQILGSWTIPWYPRCIEDLDRIDQKTLAAGAELQDDPENPHPGFHDEVYKARRSEIGRIAASYKHGSRIPNMPYTARDVETWAVIWDKLTALYPTHACKQYNFVFPLLVENCGFRRNNIPQLQDVSDYLKDTTGFTIRPVSGLLSPRDFLNSLAFRVFHATQYIRHHSQPLYTPEPDVVHELMGHVPLFADPEFADFSQTIGLASLGASDEDIRRLSACYWFSVEFGMCKQADGVKAYGAGILSSFGEMEYALTAVPKKKPWDPFEAAHTEYPITKMQPLYFVADSFKDAQLKMQRFSDSLDRPFTIKYNPISQKVITHSKNAEEYLKN